MRDDLNAAVAAEIISADQAEKLTSFFDDRLQTRGSDDPEALHFVRGMHDILMTLGLVLFLAGLFPLLPTAFSFVGLGAAWALAEFFTGQKRLVLPSIVLASAVTLFGAIVFAVLAGALLQVSTDSAGNAVEDTLGFNIFFAGGALLSASIHYLRFRLPFSVALSALSAVGVAVSLIELGLPGFVEAHLVPLMLGFGVLLFVGAMREDMADRERRTIRSDNAFWLHLLAAPALVHGLVGQQLDGALMVLGAMGLVTLLALIIDRRALLVSGLGYLTFALGALVQKLFSSGDDFYGVSLTPLVVGAVVLIIGVGWSKSRRILLPLLPIALSSRVRPATSD